MLTVTATAKEKLQETLQQHTTDPDVAIRIIPSRSKPRGLELALDKEREGDQIVESKEGKKVLLIGPDLALALKGMVMDYQETPGGVGFTISKPAPGT